MIFFIQWHALDRSEQAKYYEMAREERAKHMQVLYYNNKRKPHSYFCVQMYPGWSARDNYAIHKKRRKRKVKQIDSKEDSVEQSKEESEVFKDTSSCCHYAVVIQYKTRTFP